jgi:hypothetical protein
MKTNHNVSPKYQEDLWAAEQIGGVTEEALQFLIYEADKCPAGKRRENFNICIEEILFLATELRARRQAKDDDC